MTESKALKQAEEIGLELSKLDPEKDWRKVADLRLRQAQYKNIALLLRLESKQIDPGGAQAAPTLLLKVPRRRTMPFHDRCPSRRPVIVTIAVGASL